MLEVDTVRDSTAVIHHASYSLREIDLPGAVSTLIGVADLSKLGSTSSMELRTRETDQLTPWHRRFYDTFDTIRPLFVTLVHHLASQVFGGPFFYQAVPTLRVQLPDNLAVGQFHTDADFGHPLGEKTFWVPLTDARASSTIWIESIPGRGDYRPQEASPGACVVFEGSRLSHGNLMNRTGKSRLSIDFRCITAEDLPAAPHRSVNAGLRFAPAAYYDAAPMVPSV